MLHISTKLKQFHWKALHIEQLNQYTRNDIQCSLRQFDVGPTRTRAEISLICDYFKMIIIIINCKLCDVTLGRGCHRNVSTCDKDGEGVKTIMKFM